MKTEYNQVANKLMRLVWDEENRLNTVLGADKSLNYYTYDASGERTLKLTSNLETMNINGQYNINVYNINNYTLYTNPYMVVDPKGYTKHYYIESDRIVSKIGGGFENAPYDITEHVYNSEIPDFSHYPVKSDSMFILMMPRHFDSVYVNDDVVMDIRFKDIGFLSFIDEPEELIFWHHKDHLGSSTQITNTGAVVFHHMEYMPSGELFSEQRDWWSTPYKFNGKELDSETNLYYYGARYYTAMENIWLSVDPLASEYPSLSPYAYCANNPILFIDPDGQRITFGFLAFKSRHLFNRVYRSADAETRAKYDALKSSNVNYRINMTNLSDRAGGTTYNFAKDRVDVNINPNSSNMVGTIGDELETAYQYQVGDIGFVLNNAGVVGSLGYDMNDEVATKRAEIKATGAVNIFEGINIQLDKTTEAFKQADTGPITPGLTRDQMIENYFISDPSASQYLNKFQPGIKGVHTGGANMKNRISGTGGYTLQQLNDFKNNGAIKDFKYNGE